MQFQMAGNVTGVRELWHRCDKCSIKMGLQNGKNWRATGKKSEQFCSAASPSNMK